MNERIKELYDKLGLDFKNFQRVTVTESDMQYFAQLIVQECMQLNSKELSITAIERLLPLYVEHFGTNV